MKLDNTVDFPSTLSIQGSAIPLTVIRSRRAKRISLRICPQKRAITLTYPWRGSARKALAFLHSKEPWIASYLAKLPERITFSHGKTLPVLGNTIALCHIPQVRGQARLENNQLVVPCLPEFFARRVSDFLMKHLKEKITVMAKEKSVLLGKPFSRITIRSMSSRWGSCSTKGNLAFTSTLVFAPYEVLEYVVAHEVAHLQHMDHSRRFWKTVALLCPSYEQHRQWLKTHGNQLLRYGL